MLPIKDSDGTGFIFEILSPSKLHLLYEPDSMSTGTPEPLRTAEPMPAAPTEVAAFRGMFRGLERSLASEPGAKAEAAAAAVEGKVVVEALVTPISTASASTWFRLELEVRK